MADYNINGEKAFLVAANIGKNLRVKFNSAQTISGTTQTPTVSIAGIADTDVGVTLRDAFVATGPQSQTISVAVAIRLRSAQGTIVYTANGAITAGAAVYTAANGKVASTQGTGASLVGMALATATADGDFIEVLPL